MAQNKSGEKIAAARYRNTTHAADSKTARSQPRNRDLTLAKGEIAHVPIRKHLAMNDECGNCVVVIQLIPDSLA
jgi:hypothetical protein